MSPDNFQKLLTQTLSHQEKVCHILNSGTSLLVSCTDESNFFINILESKQTFIHADQEAKNAIDYHSSHSIEDFRNAVSYLETSHPGFFLYFLIFSKLEELGIIDRALFFHLNDSIIHYEEELDSFTLELLRHVKLNDTH